MRKNFLKKAGLLSFCAALIMNVGTTFAAPTDVAIYKSTGRGKGGGLSCRRLQCPQCGPLYGG